MTLSYLIWSFGLRAKIIWPSDSYNNLHQWKRPLTLVSSCVQLCNVLNRLSILCLHKYFMSMRDVLEFENRLDCCTQMTLNVYVVFVKISWMLLLQDVLIVPLMNILEKFMVSYMTLMNCCLLLPFILRN